MATRDTLYTIKTLLEDNHILESNIEYVSFFDKEFFYCSYDEFKNVLNSASTMDSICWKYLYECKIIGRNWYIEYDRSCKWCLRKIPDKPTKTKDVDFDVFFRRIPLYDSSDDL